MRRLRRCFVAPDVDAATVIGGEAATPADVAPEAISELWSLTQALYCSGMYPALQLCIRHRGAVVLDRAIGFARGAEPGAEFDAPRTPARLSTPFQLFSASKPLAAMLVHKLDEERLLHLEDPVCSYVPEFAAHGKEQITIRHLLSHRAGIPHVPQSEISPNLLAHPERILALLCDAQPLAPAGRRLAYHAVTAGFVIGELVRRVTGSSFKAAFEERIRGPLAVRTLRFGSTAQEISRVVHNTPTGLAPPAFVARALQRILGLPFEHAIEFSNQAAFLAAEIPAANVAATARDIAAFYQCLLDEGSLGARRIFEPATIRRATLAQSSGELDRAIGVPLRHSAGFMLGHRRVSPFGADSERAFGHVGLTNNFTWADPERQLVVALLTNGQPIVGPHIRSLLRWLRGVSTAFPRVCPTETEGEREAA